MLIRIANIISREENRIAIGWYTSCELKYEATIEILATVKATAHLKP